DVPQQRVPESQKRAVAAALDESSVKTQGVIDIALLVVLLERGLHHAQQMIELLDQRQGIGSRELHGAYLQHGAQLVRLTHLVEIRTAPARAAEPLAHHETRSLELPQRLTNRRLADVEFTRQRQFLQLRAGRVGAIEDTGDQDLANLVAHAGAFERGTGHGCARPAMSCAAVHPPPVALTRATVELNWATRTAIASRWACKAAA